LDLRGVRKPEVKTRARFGSRDIGGTTDLEEERTEVTTRAEMSKSIGDKNLKDEEGHRTFCRAGTLEGHRS